jgi:hypothetical protein
VSALPSKDTAPWCPNCKAHLEFDDIGSSQGGITDAGLNLIWCNKCGMILGGSWPAGRL